MTNKKILEIIRIPKIKDDGFLYFAQNPDHIPFIIKRVYFITSPVAGLPRGKHAHKKTRQVLFCLRGKVRMVLDDGKNRKETILTAPEKGIIIEPMVWHEMLDMNKDTILLILASKKYNPMDYIRDHHKFLELVKRHANKI